MKDIAQLAGVSRQTVSLVLNGRYLRDLKISSKVASRVNSAAQQLNYHRNALACSMKNGHSNVVGFIGDIGEQGNAYMTGMLKGMSETLQNKNFLLKIFSLTQLNFEDLCRQCIEQRPGGVICRIRDETMLDYLRREFEPYNIPVVLLGNSFKHDWCSRIVTDDERGIGLAVAHLVSLGHRRIGHVTVETEMELTVVRQHGFISSMRDAGLEVTGKSVLSVPLSFAMQDSHYHLFDDFFEIELKAFNEVTLFE
jgi:LacI family transcriptional regulator